MPRIWVKALPVRLTEQATEAPPGVHGAGRREPSDYKIRLRRSGCAHFGVLEKQFKGYMTEAQIVRTNCDNLITLLESRLDNIVWRLGFAQQLRGSQMVVHGHIQINGKKVIAQVTKYVLALFVREKSRQQEWVRQRLELATSRVLPEYLNNDLATASGEVTQAPVRTDLPFTVDIQQVVEYYSQML